MANYQTLIYICSKLNQPKKMKNNLLELTSLNAQLGRIKFSDPRNDYALRKNLAKLKPIQDDVNDKFYEIEIDNASLTDDGKDLKTNDKGGFVYTKEANKKMVSNKNAYLKETEVDFEPFVMLRTFKNGKVNEELNTLPPSVILGIELVLEQEVEPTDDYADSILEEIKLKKSN